MNPLQKLTARFRPPQLTRTRVVLALGVAVVADGIQIPLQAVPVAPEIVDVVAMAATSALVGFHWLLLPTFLVEFVPLVDMLPTWTGCVVAVIALRRRKSGSEFRPHAAPAAAAPEPPEGGTPNNSGALQHSKQNKPGIDS